MTILEIFLLTSLVIAFIDLVRVEKKVINHKKQIEIFNKRIISIDRDIKTLHFNQKMLQSTIRELHKDLKIYGEIKKSKIRFLQETPEKE